MHLRAVHLRVSGISSLFLLLFSSSRTINSSYPFRFRSNVTHFRSKRDPNTKRWTRKLTLFDFSSLADWRALSTIQALIFSFEFFFACSTIRFVAAKKARVRGDSWLMAFFSFNSFFNSILEGRVITKNHVSARRSCIELLSSCTRQPFVS